MAKVYTKINNEWNRITILNYGSIFSAGKILLNDYNTTEKVNALINKGNIHTLSSVLEACVTGSGSAFPTNNLLDNIKQFWKWENCYVWNGSEWTYSFKGRRGNTPVIFFPLKDKINL